jgi:DNA-binding response OmpR family regulator
MTIDSRVSTHAPRRLYANHVPTARVQRARDASPTNAPPSWTSVPYQDPDLRGWPPQPAKILSMLQRAGGAPVSVQDLIEGLWGGDENGGPLAAMEIVKTQICRIRKRLAGSRLRIVTVPRRGYRLVALNEETADPFASVAHGSVGARPLPPQEAAIMRLLLDRATRFVTREDIAGRLWPGAWPEAWRRIIVVLVARVRWKLQAVGHTLENQRGAGWRLVRLDEAASFAA